MATTTINLSAIPGVTAYNTKAAALSGAVDSADAITAWFQSQTTSLTNNIIVKWDKWVYVADLKAIQYTPTNSGFVTHQTAEGLTNSNQSGVVFATNRTTAKWCMINGSPTATGSIRITDVIFTTNSGGIGSEIDFNNATSTQPISDATYGWSFGLVGAGVRRFSVNGWNIHGCRSLNLLAINTDGAYMTSLVMNSDASINQRDLIHVNGPATVVQVEDCNLTSFDDSIALNAAEPLSSGDIPNYAAASWMQGWTGGRIGKAVVRNNVFASIPAIRLLGISTENANATLGDILIDGVTGNISTYVIEATAYTHGYGVNYIDTLDVRNVTPTVTSLARDAWFNFDDCQVGTLRLDLATVNLSGGGRVLNATTSCSFTTIDVGKAETSIFTDDFSGGLGSWTGGSFSTSGGKLTGTGTTHRTSAGEKTASPHYTAEGDVPASPASASLNDGIVFRWQDDSNFLTWIWNTGTGSGTGMNVQMTKVVSGSPTVLADLGSLSFTGGETLVSDAWAVGNNLMGRLTHKTGGTLAGPMVIVADSAITASGSLGFTVGAGNPPVAAIDNAAGYGLGAKPTLTTLTVRQGASGSGFTQFTYTAAPSGADAASGTWSTSAGYIDQTGRLWGVSNGQSVTVTYTKGAISGSLPTIIRGTTTLSLGALAVGIGIGI